MYKEIVPFPEIRPRQIQQQRSHFKAQHDYHRPQDFIHECRKTWRRSRSARGFLKSSDAIRYAAVIDIHRVDLRKTLQRRIQVVCRFLGDS